MSAGSTESYSLTLQNLPSSNQALGSANVTVPAGFTVATSSLALTAPAGTVWKAPTLTSDGVIELRSVGVNSKLSKNQQLVLNFDAATACSASGAGTWGTTVKQSNDFLGTGNDFNVASQTTVTVSGGGGGGAAGFELGPIGVRQEVGTPFSVTVTAKDECGAVDTGYSGTPTLTGLNSQGSQTPSYGTLSFSAGTATTSVTAALSQRSAALVVTDTAAGLTGTSNGFDVFDLLCTEPVICEETDADGTTTVTTPGPPVGGSMGLSFEDFPNSFTCEGTPSFDRKGSLAVLDPLGYAGPTITAKGRWDKTITPGTGVANFIICWSKNGISYSVAGPCTNKGKLPAATAFCILKRSRNGVGDLEIDFLMSTNDPWAVLGE